MTNFKKLVGFNQTWHKSSCGKGNSSTFKWTVSLFLRGDNFKIVEIHWQNFKIFFSRTTRPLSTNFGTKHLWVKGIQVCSNEEPFNSYTVNNWFIPLLINVLIFIWTVFSGERCGPWVSCFYLFEVNRNSNILHSFIGNC